MSTEDDTDTTDYDNALDSMTTTAQVLNELLAAAVRLYSREANISEPHAWKNLMAEVSKKTEAD